MKKKGKERKKNGTFPYIWRLIALQLGSSLASSINRHQKKREKNELDTLSYHKPSSYAYWTDKIKPPEIWGPRMKQPRDYPSLFLPQTATSYFLVSLIALSSISMVLSSPANDSTMLKNPALKTVQCVFPTEFYDFYSSLDQSTCSPIRSRPTSKNEMPWKSKK